MRPQDVDRFTRFNETEDGPLHRVLLHFESPTKTDLVAVILLNDDGLVLQEYLSCLVGQSFQETKWDANLDRVLQVSGFPQDGFRDLKPETNQKLSAWTVLAHNGDLLIPLKSVPRKITKTAELPLAIGIVISGKQNIANNKVVRAEMLPKDVPTPFVADEWGDTYNDSYDLEPRIIESFPQTVFTAVDNIMVIAKRAFLSKSYEVAANKYRKAFHYCHKYYPESLEHEELRIATDLKQRSLLNLALSSVLAGTKPGLEIAIEAADFVLDMPEASDMNRAKALYRKGRARLALGDEEAAKSDLELSLALYDDASTRKAIEDCEISRRKRLASLQKRLHGAFHE